MSKIPCRKVADALAVFVILANVIPAKADSIGKSATPAYWTSNIADPHCRFGDEKDDYQVRKPGWCKGWFCRSGDPNPRKICYDFTTGRITSSNAEGPTAPIAPNTPITVKVTGVNFYRINGKITIQQNTFGDNFKIPEIISQNVLGTAKAGAKEKSGATALTQNSNTSANIQALPAIEQKIEAKRQEQTNNDKNKKDKKYKSPKSGGSQQGTDPAKSALRELATNGTSDAEKDSAQQILNHANANGESVDEALRHYRQQLEVSRSAVEAKENFGKALQAFNAATEDFADVENLPESTQHLALTTDDLAKLREECQAIIATAFNASVDEKPIAPAALPNLRAKARAKVEAAFLKVNDTHGKLGSDNDKEIAELFAQASARHDTLIASRAERDKNFEAFLVLYSKLEDLAFGQETSLPVASTGDDVEIRFDDCLTSGAAKAEGVETCDSSKATTLLVIPIVGQRRPSFSTGIFFTGLDDPSYFKDADGVVRVNAEDRFSPVLGALIHTPLVFFRGANLSAPLSFGVALKDNNPVYLLGLSFIVGRSERSVFTLGIAGGQVTRLSGTSLGQKVVSDQPPTSKVFRTRPMIGFTYNFANR